MRLIKKCYHARLQRKAYCSYGEEETVIMNAERIETIATRNKVVQKEEFC